MYAGKLVGRFYDALRVQYLDPDTIESKHSLNVLCPRLVVCLFAEDAEFWPWMRSTSTSMACTQIGYAAHCWSYFSRRAHRSTPRGQLRTLNREGPPQGRFAHTLDRTKLHLP